MDAIVAANRLGPHAIIVIGDTLTVPTDGERSAPSAPSAPAVHVVAPGDTVWALARRYGTTVDAIVAANDLGPAALIRVGQRLRLGTAASGVPAVAPAASPELRITVRAGDTLAALAARHHTTVARLVDANGLADPDLIREGQGLVVPGGAGAPAPTGLVGDTFLGRTYADDVVASANRHKASLMERDVPSRDQMQRLVIATARKHGVDTALAQAIAYQESGFDMRAVSPADAVGVMQVIPASGEWASQMAGRDLDLLDPEDNVLAGILILRSHSRGFTDRGDAIGAYYQGAAAVRQHGLYPGTVDYVRSVTALIGRFR